MYDEDDPKARRKRDFLLFLSPFVGHDYATKFGGFDPPAVDVMEREVRQVLNQWLIVQNSSAGEVLSDTAWWMLRVLEDDLELDSGKALAMLDHLISYAISVLNQLVEQGSISFMDVDYDELPEVVISTDMELSDDDMEILRNLESDTWPELGGNDE